jgi:hypothetical protein
MTSTGLHKDSILGQSSEGGSPWHPSDGKGVSSEAKGGGGADNRSSTANTES